MNGQRNWSALLAYTTVAVSLHRRSVASLAATSAGLAPRAVHRSVSSGPEASHHLEAAVRRTVHSPKDDLD